MRTSGLRAGSSIVGVTFLADDRGDPAPPKVAVAVSKRIGNAVERNRLRRRFRSAFRALTSDPASAIPSGAYLLSAGPEASSATFEKVKIELNRGIRRLGAGITPSGSRADG